jgi:hypothetical protein
MLSSFSDKILGLPVYAWVIIGAAGLYAFAHFKGSKLPGTAYPSPAGGPAPLALLSQKQPASISPTATLLQYNPASGAVTSGAFGGSNPWGGVPV